MTSTIKLHISYVISLYICIGYAPLWNLTYGKVLLVGLNGGKLLFILPPNLTLNTGIVSVNKESNKGQVFIL